MNRVSAFGIGILFSASAACGQANSSAIRISGSPSMEACTRRLTEWYHNTHPQMTFTVTGGGPAKGISALIDGRTEIDGPNISAVLACVIRKTPVSTSGIQNFLTAKKFRLMRLHVIDKLSFPFVIHLRKAVPLITKTQCRFHLFRLFAHRRQFTGKSTPQVR